jgi:hypothetical protein
MHGVVPHSSDLFRLEHDVRSVPSRMAGERIALDSDMLPAEPFDGIRAKLLAMAASERRTLHDVHQQLRTDC